MSFSLESLLQICVVASAGLLILSLALMLLVGCWRLLREAGMRPWQILIPVWNLWALWRMAGDEFYLFLVNIAFYVMIFFGLTGNYQEFSLILMAVGFLGVFVMALILGIDIAHSFSASTAFGVGIALLSPIFLYVLAKRGEAYEQDYDPAYGEDYGQPYGQDYGEPYDEHLANQSQVPQPGYQEDVRSQPPYAEEDAESFFYDDEDDQDFQAYDADDDLDSFSYDGTSHMEDKGEKLHRGAHMKMPPAPAEITRSDIDAALDAFFTQE